MTAERREELQRLVNLNYALTLRKQALVNLNYALTLRKQAYEMIDKHTAAVALHLGNDCLVAAIGSSTSLTYWLRRVLKLNEDIERYTAEGETHALR